MLTAFAKRLIVLCAVAMSPLAWAATSEIEPNNSCAMAQDLGHANTVSLSGLIDTADVDFFQLTASPGQLLEVDMRGAPSGAGTLPNMLMGLMNPDCSNAKYSDNSENGLEARLILIAPANGQVRIAAAGNPDFSFTGTNTDTGTYTLTIGAPTVPVIAFSGTLTDAVTGRPLTTSDFAVVDLMSCPSADYQLCTSYSAQGIPDANGRYAIAQALPPGTYQIRVLADNHASYRSAPFTVTGFEGPSKHNYALSPLPVVVSDVTPCSSLEAGGTCTYSYVVTNTTAGTLDTSVWSQADQGPNGTPMFRSNYTVGKGTPTPFTLTLAPGASRKVVQSLPIRGMPSGSTGDVNIYVSTRGNQSDTIGYGFGFAYTVTAANQAVKATRSAVPARPLATRDLHASARRALSTTGGADIITGVAFDPLTRQPITDGSVSVQLQGCQDPSFELCMGTVGLFNVDANGRYTHGAGKLSPGRYQVWAFRQDGTTYGLSYSKAFDYDGGVASVNVSAAKAPLEYAAVTACAGADALPAGAPCVATYTLTNVTAAAMTVDLWAVVSTSDNGSAKGYSQYDVGIDGSSQIRSVTIAPGATLKVSHSLPLSRRLLSGASASCEFFASLPGKPASTLGNAQGFYINVVP